MNFLEPTTGSGKTQLLPTSAGCFPHEGMRSGDSRSARPPRPYRDAAGRTRRAESAPRPAFATGALAAEGRVPVPIPRPARAIACRRISSMGAQGCSFADGPSPKTSQPATFCFRLASFTLRACFAAGHIIIGSSFGSCPGRWIIPARSATSAAYQSRQDHCGRNERARDRTAMESHVERGYRTLRVPTSSNHSESSAKDKRSLAGFESAFFSAGLTEPFEIERTFQLPPAEAHRHRNHGVSLPPRAFKAASRRRRAPG